MRPDDFVHYGRRVLVDRIEFLPQKKKVDVR